MQRPVFLSLVLAAWPCFALEPPETDKAATVLLEEILGADQGSAEYMEWAVETFGWTPGDCADVLCAAESALRGSTNRVDVYRRRNAIGLLGDFGGTNAIPRLSAIMREETSWTKRIAAQKYLYLTATVSFPGWDVPLKETILQAAHTDRLFAHDVYAVISSELDCSAPSGAFRENLLRFLLDQTAVERHESAFLDEILCREVPKWRASPQRAANAAKMLREHPGDTALAAFFEGVRADAAKAAAEARAADATNALQAAASRVEGIAAAPLSPATANAASTNAPAASAPKAVSSAADADPWADLLSDIPEKKPWVPPDGEPTP